MSLKILYEMVLIFYKRFQKSTTLVTNDHQGVIEKLGVKWSSMMTVNNVLRTIFLDLLGR